MNVRLSNIVVLKKVTIKIEGVQEGLAVGESLRFQRYVWRGA